MTTPTRRALCHPLTRREAICVGGLTSPGLTLPTLLGAHNGATAGKSNRLASNLGATFGQAALFECRLSLIRYRNISKDPREATELGSVPFLPEFGKKQSFTIDRFLGSRGGGENFRIGAGLGVMLSLTKTSPGVFKCAARAGLCVSAVTLEFGAAPRDENNTT